MWKYPRNLIARSWGSWVLAALLCLFMIPSHSAQSQGAKSDMTKSKIFDGKYYGKLNDDKCYSSSTIDAQIKDNKITGEIVDANW